MDATAKIGRASDVVVTSGILKLISKCQNSDWVVSNQQSFGFVLYIVLYIIEILVDPYIGSLYFCTYFNVQGVVPAKSRFNFPLLPPF